MSKRFTVWMDDDQWKYLSSIWDGTVPDAIRMLVHERISQGVNPLTGVSVESRRYYAVEERDDGTRLVLAFDTKKSRKIWIGNNVNRWQLSTITLPGWITIDELRALPTYSDIATCDRCRKEKTKLSILVGNQIPICRSCLTKLKEEIDQCERSQS